MATNEKAAFRVFEAWHGTIAKAAAELPQPTNAREGIF
jgi:hypothetical protein